MFGATDTKRQVVSYVLHGERSGSWLVESPTVNYIRELHPCITSVNRESSSIFSMRDCDSRLTIQESIREFSAQSHPRS